MKVSSLCWRYLPGMVYRKHRQPMWSWHLKRKISNLGEKEVHRKPLQKLTKLSHKPVSSLPERHLGARAGAGCPLHQFLMLERLENCRLEKHNFTSQPVDILKTISSYSMPSQPWLWYNIWGNLLRHQGNRWRFKFWSTPFWSFLWSEVVFPSVQSVSPTTY